MSVKIPGKYHSCKDSHPEAPKGEISRTKLSKDSDICERFPWRGRSRRSTKCIMFMNSIKELVLGIGQNFIVDHQFCQTDRSSTNNRLVENIFILNLALFQVLIHSSRSIRVLSTYIFSYFSMKTYFVCTH